MENEAVFYRCLTPDCRVLYIEEEYHEGMICKVCGSDKFETINAKGLKQIVEEASRHYEERISKIKERTQIIYPKF